MILASSLLLASSVVFLLLLSVGVLKETRILLTSEERATPGSAVKRFALLDPESGERRASAELLVGRRVLLFVSSGCGSCKKLLSNFSPPKTKDLLIVCSGTRRACAKLQEQLGAQGFVMVDEEGEALSRFVPRQVPFAAEIENGILISYTTPTTFQEVVDLLPKSIEQASIKGA